MYIFYFILHNMATSIENVLRATMVILCHITIVHEASLFYKSAPARCRDKYIAHRVLGIALVCSHIGTLCLRHLKQYGCRLVIVLSKRYVKYLFSNSPCKSRHFHMGWSHIHRFQHHRQCPSTQVDRSTCTGLFHPVYRQPVA